MTDLPRETRRIRSVVTADGHVRVTLETAPLPEPREGHVLVRVEAAPLNPSDIAVLLAGAFLVLPDRRDDLAGDSVAALFYVANWRFLLSDEAYFAGLAARRGASAHRR